jgi:hypothetical protein
LARRAGGAVIVPGGTTLAQLPSMRSDARSTSARRPLSIPLARERLTVGRESVPRSRVRVKTTTDVERVVVDQRLSADEGSIDRIPCDRLLDEPLTPRVEGEVRIASRSHFASSGLIVERSPERRATG